MQATHKGYLPFVLSGYAEAVGNTGILERMEEAIDAISLKYHRECKSDLYNKSLKITKESKREYQLYRYIKSMYFILSIFLSIPLSNYHHEIILI